MTDKPRVHPHTKTFGVGVKLVGTDGNLFAVVGRCKQALEHAGQSREAKELIRRAFKAMSYDEALGICLEYVDAS